LIDENQSPGWVGHYHAALLELDSQRLKGRIQKAETEIKSRLDALAASGEGSGERRAIRDALQNLRVLEQELMGKPSAAITKHHHPEVSGDYVVFVDANRRYVDMTDGVCELLGYSREELLDKTIDDIAAPHVKSTVSDTFQQYVDEGGMSGQFVLQARDGRPIPIRYDARVFPDGCLVACWKPLESAA
jgi:PAS domain S-box-containing protein